MECTPRGQVHLFWGCHLKCWTGSWSLALECPLWVAACRIGQRLRHHKIRINLKVNEDPDPRAVARHNSLYQFPSSHFCLLKNLRACAVISNRKLQIHFTSGSHLPGRESLDNCWASHFLSSKSPRGASGAAGYNGRYCLFFFVFSWMYFRLVLLELQYFVMVHRETKCSVWVIYNSACVGTPNQLYSIHFFFLAAFILNYYYKALLSCAVFIGKTTCIISSACSVFLSCPVHSFVHLLLLSARLYS